MHPANYRSGGWSPSRCTTEYSLAPSLVTYTPTNSSGSALVPRYLAAYIGLPPANNLLYLHPVAAFVADNANNIHTKHMFTKNGFPLPVADIDERPRGSLVHWLEAVTCRVKICESSPTALSGVGHRVHACQALSKMNAVLSEYR